MMDPNVGWFQTENQGPALTLWMKLWKDFKSSDKPVAKEDDNCSRLVSRLQQLFPKDNPSSTYDLQNNQDLIRKHNGIPWRKPKGSQYEGIDGLHQEIEDFFAYMKPKLKEYEIRTEVQTRITGIIERLWPDAVVSTSLFLITI